MLYTVMYMPSTRTQIYLREDQRARVDELAAMLGVPLAEVVRRALDDYLERTAPDPQATLAETFGALSEVEAPDRSEWDLRSRG